MAKKKKLTDPPIIKHAGIVVPLSHPVIPDDWMPVDDYSSHRPMLYRAIMNMRHGTFYEFGTGNGSTPVLKKIYGEQFPERELVSIETDPQWFEIFYEKCYEPILLQDDALWYKHKNHFLIKAANYMNWNTFHQSILFIDSAPGEERKSLISKHAIDAKAIIVHDTEPGAEYVYGMDSILKTFKFRCDLICDGMPQTTIVSNRYDFKEWDGVINEKIKFVCQ